MGQQREKRHSNGRIPDRRKLSDPLPRIGGMTAASLLDDDGLLAALVEREARMRRDYADILELIAEAKRRGVDSLKGYRDLPDLFKDLLRWSTRESRRRITQAEAVCETTSPSGAPVPPAYPHTAAAVAELSAEQIEVITTAPQAVEQILTEAAAVLDPTKLKYLARSAAARLDQDGPEPTEQELVQPRNTLRTTKRRDGRLGFEGVLDAEAGAKFLALLSPLAKPRPSTIEGPDLRSAAERHGDAFVEVIDLAASTNGLPSEGGEKPHLHVTIDHRALRDEIGHALLATGDTITAAQARRLACEAKIIPLVLGSNSEPLDIGRAAYTATIHQRRALTVRDRGCAFPSCDRPAKWCQVHHIDWWSHAGETNIDNLILLCGHHHRLIHHTDWTVEMINGQPVFRPPRYIDPDRTPLRNQLHPRLE